VVTFHGEGGDFTLSALRLGRWLTLYVHNGAATHFTTAPLDMVLSAGRLDSPFTAYHYRPRHRTGSCDVTCNGNRSRISELLWTEHRTVLGLTLGPRHAVSA
jgi:hypothetical protein